MSLPGLEAVRALAPVPDAWLVGGSVRDLLLGRDVVDVDLVVADDPAAAARSLARTAGGAARAPPGASVSSSPLPPARREARKRPKEESRPAR